MAGLDMGGAPGIKQLSGACVCSNLSPSDRPLLPLLQVQDMKSQTTQHTSGGRADKERLPFLPTV